MHEKIRHKFRGRLQPRVSTNLTVKEFPFKTRCHTSHVTYRVFVPLTLHLYEASRRNNVLYNVRVVNELEFPSECLRHRHRLRHAQTRPNPFRSSTKQFRTDWKQGISLPFVDFTLAQSTRTRHLSEMGKWCMVVHAYVG